MNPKFYIIGGWLVLLAVAIAPTFTNDPIPERRMHVQTFKVETSSTSSQAVQSFSESSSATSSTSFLTVEKPTTTLSPTTIPTIVTTTTMVLSPEAVTEDTTTTSVTLSVLQTAQNLIGKSRTELGFTHFWCAEAYRYFVSSPWLSDSPAQMSLQLEATNDPQPGDAVFIDLIPEMKTGQITHVAMFVSFNEDGSIKTIEGNGQDREHITIGVRYPYEIISYGTAPSNTN